MSFMDKDTHTKSSLSFFSIYALPEPHTAFVCVYACM